MGRIVAVHLGDGNVVRVATGDLKRPVEKICILPMPNNVEVDKSYANLSQN